MTAHRPPSTLGLTASAIIHALTPAASRGADICRAEDRDERGPVYLLHWSYGAWTEMGRWCDADQAKARDDCGHWIPMGQGVWRSDDGRRLIEPCRVTQRRLNTPGFTELPEPPARPEPQAEMASSMMLTSTKENGHD